ncbi:unnamed protein product, partial [Callosobruchus maculatus]
DISSTVLTAPNIWPIP